MKSISMLPTFAPAALLGGCVIVDADEAVPSSTFGHDSDLGTVYGAAVHHDRVSFRVSSNGCTDESYFDTDVRSRSAGRHGVSIDRVRADNCRARMPEGVEISYSFAKLGLPDGADVSLLNPVRRR